MVATQQYEAKTRDDRLKRALGKTLEQVEAQSIACQKKPVKCELRIVKHFKSKQLH